jgi:hypothetical protein
MWLIEFFTALMNNLMRDGPTSTPRVPFLPDVQRKA